MVVVVVMKRIKAEGLKNEAVTLKKREAAVAARRTSLGCSVVLVKAWDGKIGVSEGREDAGDVIGDWERDLSRGGREAV